jgi:RHS repeat-associated protein
VLREQKWIDMDAKYRYGYQGKYAEKDEETGWNHFELREYDPVIGRWLVKDPAGQYYSPYVAMGNNPVSNMDPDGGMDGPGGGSVINSKFALINSFIAKRQADRRDSFGDAFQSASFGLLNSITSAIDFAKSLATTNGWKNVGQSLGTLAQMGNQYSVEGMLLREQMAEGVTNYISSLPDKSANEIAYDVGSLAGVAFQSMTFSGLSKFSFRQTGSVSTVQSNRLAGNAFRDELADQLTAAGRQVKLEVYKPTIFGKRYIDIEVYHNGKLLGGIETKVGGSRYLPSQRAKDFWLGMNGYTVNVARKP